MPGCQVPALAVGVNAGLLLSALVVCVSRIFSLSLLATVRGGTSFLCPKRQRNEAKKTLSDQGLISVHSVQFSYMGTPKARCSPEPPMCETLLLANSYTHTLRPQRSRASTIANKRIRLHAYLLLQFLVGWLRACAERTDLVGGCPRIARGEPLAGSVTGGEACGYPCSEKEGFTHPWLWRAPCFWGTTRA